LFNTIYYSLCNIDYMHFSGYVGLGNYIKVFGNPKFYSSLIITLVITLSAAVFSLCSGTLIALWADKKRGLFGYSIQIVALIPWVTSMVVAGLLWKWVFDGEMGLFNYLLSLLQIKPLFLFKTAFSATLTTIFVIAWRTIGYSMVMILAGLKGLSHDLLEAAAMDGANGRQVFWRVILPMIKTPALISSIVLTMSNFNNNTIPLVLTGGGPGEATNVITLLLYRTGFTYFQFGYASAQSIVVLAINVIIIAVYIKAVRYNI
jgi:ABC-type sugar transport system permease subunit